MRVRTKTLPRPANVAQEGWDGAALGGTQANVVALPFVFIMYWVMGYEWLGLAFFGAWVFFVTLWGKGFDFAVRIVYAPPPEERS